MLNLWRRRNFNAAQVWMRQKKGEEGGAAIKRKFLIRWGSGGEYMWGVLTRKTGFSRRTSIHHFWEQEMEVPSDEVPQKREKQNHVVLEGDSWGQKPVSFFPPKIRNTILIFYCVPQAHLNEKKILWGKWCDGIHRGLKLRENCLDLLHRTVRTPPPPTASPTRARSVDYIIEKNCTWAIPFPDEHYNLSVSPLPILYGIHTVIKRRI